MRTRVSGIAITILTVTCFAAPSLAADDASVKKDLFTVITLQDCPAGLVNFATKGDNDHIASCKGRAQVRTQLTGFDRPPH
jgi:hypothetical protein